jgi:hypothetical protein
MENPPLWVWAIVVGLIIAGKYAYRWKTTKQLAKEMEQKEDSRKAMTNSDIKNNNNTESIPPVLELQYHINIVVINIALVPIEITLKKRRERLELFRPIIFLK